MIRTTIGKNARRWLAATTAVAALAAPLVMTAAEAAAKKTTTKAGAFERKKDAFSKKTDLFRTKEPRIDPAAKSPKLEKPIEAILIRLRTGGDAVSHVADLDKAAMEAGADLRGLLDKMETTARTSASASAKKLAKKLRRKYKKSLLRRTEQYEKAEGLLRDAEKSMWRGFAGGDLAKPSIVDEPLAAALLQLQIELRRMLGVRLHTEVRNLAEMPGCAGDLILDRLVARYGAAVLSVSDDHSAEVEVLRQIATQLACISAEQSRRLDYALYAAYFRAFERLDEAGLGALQGKLARLVAPLMLLVHDTVKHRGHAAASWYWWNEHREILEDEVGRLGWATGDVYWMYDRIDGALIGYPACAGSGPDLCVHPDVLLDSLRDPAALGRGDCALSGMVASGMTSMGGRGDRYACSQDCSDVSGGDAFNRFGGGKLDRGSLGNIRGKHGGDFPGSLRNASLGSGGNDLPWYGLTSGDFSAMQSECNGGAGGTGGGADAGTQGPGGSLGGWGGIQECMDEFLSQPASPFHAHAQCVVDSVGGNDPLDLSSAFQGVPMDPKCTISDGGGDDEDAPTDADEADGGDEVDPAETGDGKEESLGQKVWNAIKTFFSIPTSPSGPGGVVGVELELLDPENGKKIYGTASAVILNRLELAHASGEISTAEYDVLKEQKPGEIREYLNNKGIKDCANPEDCSDSCTGLNSQMAARRECDQQFLEDITPPEYQGSNDPNDPDHVINWGPDGNPNEQGQIDGVLGCMIDQAGTGGPSANPQCGLVTCADGLSTSWSAANCCMDLGNFDGTIPVHDSCFQMQCSDGNPSMGPNGICTCAATDGVVVGNPEPPVGPERPGFDDLLSGHLR